MKIYSAMTLWEKYTSKKTKVRLTNLISKYIIKELGRNLTDFFRYDTPQRTRLIKDTLSILGKRKLIGKDSFCVLSHGLSYHLRQSHGGDFSNKEWLYDLHWYTEIKEPYEPYMPTSVPLVVECEWTPNRRGEKIQVPYSGVKYDFQKLLVANADLRLMIFKIKKNDDLLELDKYFDKAIDSYKHLEKNSKFLFIAFEEKIKGFYYTEKLKI